MDEKIACIRCKPPLEMDEMAVAVNHVWRMHHDELDLTAGEYAIDCQVAGSLRRVTVTPSAEGGR